MGNESGIRETRNVSLSNIDTKFSQFTFRTGGSLEEKDEGLVKFVLVPFEISPQKRFPLANAMSLTAFLSPLRVGISCQYFTVS